MERRRCCFYVRVSTGEQSTKMQERELTAYAKSRGWIVSRTYRDVASGGDNKRPALRELMSDCRKKKRGFEVLLVWKFDRFARSLSFLLQSLEVLRTSGVDFVSATEQIDTTQAHGEMMFQIIGAIAQWERALIRERVRAGLQSAKERGIRIGRPPRVVLPATEIARMRQMRKATRAPFRALAKEFGTTVWTAHRLCAGKVRK